MKFVDPLVIHVAGTSIDREGIQLCLADIGAPDWNTNASSDGEELIEFSGKLCYKSFSADLNDNLTRVRTNRNHEYISEGIVKVGHGSVLEHVHHSFVFLNVSRVFTHELVRHRLANYSQESLRFVRLTELKAYFPSVFTRRFLESLETDEKGPVLVERPELMEEALREFMRETFEELEQRQHRLTKMLGLDKIKNFGLKKKLTSAMRRMAPIGLATNVMMTTNLRNYRHIIEMRTSRHAEEEIRVAFAPVFEWLYNEHPAVFADASVEEVEGLPEVTFKYRA